MTLVAAPRFFLGKNGRGGKVTNVKLRLELKKHGGIIVMFFREQNTGQTS